MASNAFRMTAGPNEPWPILPKNPDDPTPPIQGPAGYQPTEDELTLDSATDLSDVTELEDGSAVVNIGPELPGAAAEGTEEDFYANLADGVVPEDELQRLASNALLQVTRDKDSRKKRDEQYAEGIKRTGLGNEAPGGADFQGASRAVHPVLIEGCVDFAARAMKELFPPSGPVKTRIIGKATEAKLQKAERKKTYMNWQLTTQIREYRRELEVALTQLPLGGSQYMKFWWDPRFKRPIAEYVPIDDMLLPFEATDLYTAQRATHVQRITRQTFDERTESGLYREIPAGETTGDPEQTESAQAAAKVDGAEASGFNEDGLRIEYEQHVYLTLESDPLARGKSYMPYIMTVDEPTGKVVNLRRNWDPKSTTTEKLDWLIELPMIPWRGAYSIGLAHVIGSLAGAATGALRALLDSAHINNMPGAIKLKGAKISGQNISIEPTQITEIEAAPGVDDIKKLAMPLPFNPPSTVLFSLLEWITAQAKGVVAVADEKIGEATNTMPVGTALALIEQGSITFSSIHARLHEAQKRALAIIHRLNGEHLDDNTTVEELGELVVNREDFEGPMDIEPVSDPAIFSDSQRYAQQQAVMQLAAAFPQLYKVDKLNRRALQLLKYPDPDEVLNAPREPEELDAATENVSAADPESTLKAYPQQDHFAHLQTHIIYMVSPIFCANPFMATPSLGKLLEHCKEHMNALYAKHMLAATQAVQASSQGQEVPLAQAMATAAQIADQMLAEQLGPLMPHLQKAAELAQQFKPQIPGDPALQIAQIKAQSDAAANASKEKIEQMRAQNEQMLKQVEQQGLMQDRMLEQWATQQELNTAQRNADLAAMQANLDRRNQILLEQMNQQHEVRMAQLEGRISMMLESKKQEAAQQLEGQRAAAGERQTLIQQEGAERQQAAQHKHDEKVAKSKPAKPAKKE